MRLILVHYWRNDKWQCIEYAEKEEFLMHFRGHRNSFQLQIYSFNLERAKKKRHQEDTKPTTSQHLTIAKRQKQRESAREYAPKKWIKRVKIKDPYDSSLPYIHFDDSSFICNKLLKIFQFKSVKRQHCKNQLNASEK